MIYRTAEVRLAHGRLTRTAREGLLPRLVMLASGTAVRGRRRAGDRVRHLRFTRPDLDPSTPVPNLKEST
ncbi:hypothetical protein GBF35_23555 [Nonomuraea phyllanthi]|uniref:hypothetical protein n=1 Tax=Nonomuraea phyllanthi TaxID=2219224 RepID=UPI0012930A7A|nr:hypothetical protein [Nonomuraea phyllanthi]QFY09245.1 hypothetical protein GBF35_23555 [Nonomuraea phyllanthi]